MMRLFISTVTWLCLTASCVLAHEEKKEELQQTTPLPETDIREYQGCSSDSDCVVAVNGCCDCANGGQDVAVNKGRMTDFRLRFNCENIVCTQLATEPPCGSGVVTCVSHQCRYISKLELP